MQQTYNKSISCGIEHRIFLKAFSVQLKSIIYYIKEKSLKCFTSYRKSKGKHKPILERNIRKQFKN